MAGIKPFAPTVYERAGAPAFWAPTDGPRRTSASDTGDVADLMGTAAGVRPAGCAWAVGRQGACLGIAGSAVPTPYAPAFGTGDFTVAVAFRRSPVGGGGTQILLGKDAYPVARDWALISSYTAPGSIDWFDYHTFEPTAASGFASGEDGAWHDVVVIRRSGVLSFVIDDRPYAGGANTTRFSEQNSLYLGGRQEGSIPFYGLLDNVRLWPDRALSDAETARETDDPFWRLRPPSRLARYFTTTRQPLTASPGSIATAEAVGAPALSFGRQQASPTSVGPAESFGTPSLAPGTLTVSPGAITPAEAFGAPSLAPGGWNVGPAGVATAEGFGTPALSSPEPPSFIRRAVLAALAGSAGVAAVVGPDITPVSRREKKAPPALTFQLVSNVRERTLDGPLGKSRARFRFVAYSKDAVDGEAAAEAVRNLLDGFRSLDSGLLGGLARVDWCHQADESDDREPAPDGSDRGTFETSCSYEIRYREPKPAR